MYHHLGLCPGPCDNLVTSEEYKNSIINIVKTLQGKKRSHIRELEKSMLKLSEDENYEQAARIRDKIRDLQYLSQRIDIHYGDAEEEFRSIQANRFSAGIKEVVAILGLAIPEHRIKHARIECYDISNLGEEITYGSMVVSEGPLIKPSHYRVFKLSREGKRNDPEMLKRVLERRLKYLQKEEGRNQKQDESLYSPPSLILLDGAQVQLSACRTVVPTNIGMLGISKGKHLKRSGQEQQDEFWVIKSDNTIKKVRIENPFLFQHLRDEAHRFAIKHLRQGKRYLQKKSVLDDIPGIGTKRRKLLLKRFGSVDKIKETSKKELIKILKNTRAGEQVYRFFHP